MSAWLRHVPGVFLGALLGTLIALGSGVLANREEVETTIPFKELRTFTEVFHRVKSNYVEEIEDSALLENAIRGMLSGLDPHSSYLDIDEFLDLQTSTSGEFGGLGIEVGMEDGFVKVIAPIDDTPAQRAGVKAGDVIIRLDDTPVKGMNLMDAVKVMRGKPGTKIVLTIVRENQDRPVSLEIERAIIQVKSVRSRSLEEGYAYVRISHFQAHTAKDLRGAIAELGSNYNGKFKGLVLDLRNNPGGVLNAAVDVSDAFLNQGLIVYTEGRVDDASLTFKAQHGDVLTGAPIVVLVNGGSASASEIVAGALQDHRRAVIMGHKTFGKGSVQTILPMNNGSALKLTTARYYTPKGRSIQAEGIVPDIELANVQVAKLPGGENVKEADLLGHLSNGDKPKSSEDSKTEEELVTVDYALHEALNLLKGLNIMDGKRS
jgi:carboxyl-terminal processing protease